MQAGSLARQPGAPTVWAGVADGAPGARRVGCWSPVTGTRGMGGQGPSGAGGHFSSVHLPKRVTLHTKKCTGPAHFNSDRGIQLVIHQAGGENPLVPEHPLVPCPGTPTAGTAVLFLPPQLALPPLARHVRRGIGVSGSGCFGSVWWPSLSQAVARRKQPRRPSLGGG